MTLEVDLQNLALVVTTSEIGYFDLTKHQAH